MKAGSGSIRLRLMVLAAFVLLVALVVAGFALTQLFSRHLERRVGQELDAHLAQLTGAIRMGDGGPVELVREPADPRFARVFGGLYWQIDDESDGTSLRSRSLWDFELDLPRGNLQPGELHVHDAAGPRDTRLLVHERIVLIPANGKDRRMRVSVAVSRSELDELASGFANDMVPALVILGLVLLAGLGFQIGAGLRPLSAIRHQLGEVRSAKRSRLDGDVPSEIVPLVEEVNSLLASQEAEMVRARDRAADMAHGLKTPMTALVADIERLRQSGETRLAGEMGEAAERMQRHIRRELVRSRINHSGGRRTSSPAKTAGMLARTLERAGGKSGIRFEVAVPGDVHVAMDEDDLAEVLGNLMENAHRHAASSVKVTALAEGETVWILVDDDGPGMAAGETEAAMRRGVRLDQAGSSGLGLAIVSDVLQAYGSHLQLENREAGGLRACFRLPAIPQH